jgi:hypothetical protein
VRCEKALKKVKKKLDRSRNSIGREEKKKDSSK